MCFNLGLNPTLNRVQRSVSIQLLMFGHCISAAAGGNCTQVNKTEYIGCKTCLVCIIHLIRRRSGPRQGSSRDYISLNFKLKETKGLYHTMTIEIQRWHRDDRDGLVWLSEKNKAKTEQNQNYFICHNSFCNNIEQNDTLYVFAI